MRTIAETLLLTLFLTGAFGAANWWGEKVSTGEYDQLGLNMSIIALIAAIIVFFGKSKRVRESNKYPPQPEKPRGPARPQDPRV